MCHLGQLGAYYHIALTVTCTTHHTVNMITLRFLPRGAGVRIILRVYRVSVETCLDMEIGTERGEHINVSAWTVSVPLMEKGLI